MTDDDTHLVRLEVEVPGTPEEVWQAIATGPGMECWFVPAEVEEREGGSITTHHGPYGDSTGTITAWEPPNRFAYEEPDWLEGAPPWATEFIVEARAGGTCVVRLVSGLYSQGSDWADEIDPSAEGWAQGLENLRLYLTHFPGRSCSTLLVAGQSPETPEQACRSLAGALGIGDPAEGEEVESATGAPPLRGRVVTVKDNGFVLLTDEPANAIVELFAVRFTGPPTHVTARGYLYGDDSDGAVAEAEPAWRSWWEERFPAVGTPA